MFDPKKHPRLQRLANVDISGGSGWARLSHPLFQISVITASQRSCGKVMFYICLLFCSQGVPDPIFIFCAQCHVLLREGGGVSLSSRVSVKGKGPLKQAAHIILECILVFMQVLINKKAFQQDVYHPLVNCIGGGGVFQTPLSPRCRPQPLPQMQTHS